MRRKFRQSHEITLVTVTYQDLTLTRIQEKIPARLPIYQTDLGRPYVETLEKLSRQYRAKITMMEKAQAQTENVARS